MINSTLTNANILIVDDQQANVDILTGLLEMEGFNNLVYTSDSRQVMALYDRFKPDLILLDLMMPYLNGFEVMKLLKNKQPTGSYIPILVLTADITSEAKKRALKNGANDFLTKPFDLTEVALRIRNLLYTKYLHQQMEMQNQLLEQKVKERTAKLEETNLELLASKERAESSDRLKTAFIQNISHEIRTPLNGILGFSDLLVEPDTSVADKEQFISMIQLSSNRLLSTIDDYVNIAMIVSGNMKVHYETIDVNAVLRDSWTQFVERMDAKGLDFKLDLAHNTGVTIETDLSMLKRVLYHLLDNAIKFTHKGTIDLGYEVKQDVVEFFIKDTGIGVKEDIQEKIFDVFMQEDVATTRGHEGSGLGLSIVKGLLVLLGGDIRLESIKGEGSAFFFTLPILINKH